MFAGSGSEPKRGSVGSSPSRLLYSAGPTLPRFGSDPLPDKLQRL